MTCFPLGGFMIADMWRDVIMKAVMERFSPIVLKVLADSRVQALLTQALNLQADMRQNIESQVKLVARTLELVTRDELSSLRSVVKNLESEVTRLRAELDQEREREKASSKPEPASRHEPEPKEAPKTRKTPSKSTKSK